MIAELAEARRRRVGMQIRLDALRKHVDLELGALASELHAIERLERQGEKAARALEPELFAEGAA